jgi:type IV secretion system protein VirD4
VKPVSFKVLTKGNNSSGMVVGFEKHLRYEIIHYLSNTPHAVIYGITGSGKSRSFNLQTIGLTSILGDSMVITDPKGELYDYTFQHLLRQGYEVLCLDFKSPLKSVRVNFLQPINQCIDTDDIPGAVEATWDLTTQLVGESKTGEKIWSNGEASIIAASIMCVAYDNKDKENHQFRNLANVYSFIAEMCKTVINADGDPILPLSLYMNDLSDKHPAKKLVAISDIAPSRTRGSFYTSALTTLKLFTSNYIHAMTAYSDFDLKDIGRKKTALFIILPDDRTTYYSIASLFVSQLSLDLSKLADEHGGALPINVIFDLDEFGNFTAIPDMDTKMSMGRSKGIWYYLYLQSKVQLKAIYGEDDSIIILSNCNTTIFLNTEDESTKEHIVKKLGTYTTMSHGRSSDSNIFKDGSHNASIIQRPLLMSDELDKLERPYALLINEGDKTIINMPDLSKWYFNKLFGMGNVKYNKQLRVFRMKQRSFNIIDTTNLAMWNIWKHYQRKAKIKGGKNSSKTMNHQDNFKHNFLKKIKDNKEN